MISGGGRRRHQFIGIFAKVFSSQIERQARPMRGVGMRRLARSEQEGGSAPPPTPPLHRHTPAMKTQSFHVQF